MIQGVKNMAYLYQFREGDGLCVMGPDRRKFFSADVLVRAKTDAVSKFGPCVSYVSQSDLGQTDLLRADIVSGQIQSIDQRPVYTITLSIDGQSGSGQSVEINKPDEKTTLHIDITKPGGAGQAVNALPIPATSGLDNKIVKLPSIDVPATGKDWIISAANLDEGVYRIDTGRLRKYGNKRLEQAALDGRVLVDGEVEIVVLG